MTGSPIVIKPKRWTLVHIAPWPGLNVYPVGAFWTKRGARKAREKCAPFVSDGWSLQIRPARCVP